jgi:hypothetical protein
VIQKDERNHRLFSACHRPPRLVIFDTTTGKPVTTLEIGGGADDMFYDARLRRLYLSGTDASLDEVDQLDPDHYGMRQRIPAPLKARTSAFSPELKMLFQGVSQQNGQPAPIQVYRTGK